MLLVLKALIVGCISTPLLANSPLVFDDCSKLCPQNNVHCRLSVARSEALHILPSQQTFNTQKTQMAHQKCEMCTYKWSLYVTVSYVPVLHLPASCSHLCRSTYNLFCYSCDAAKPESTSYFCCTHDGCFMLSPSPVSPSLFLRALTPNHTCCVHVLCDVKAVQMCVFEKEKNRKSLKREFFTKMTTNFLIPATQTTL